MSQNDLGLKLNYRFGVPLTKQLSPDEVAASRSLRGSRYDRVERTNVPVMEFRQRKTLSVFLATPPWDLSAGETVALKLQVRSRHGIRQLSAGRHSGAEPDAAAGQHQRRRLDGHYARTG